ncbi:1-deoxy-D-xylulose-5-phosphate synthase [Prolixibacteraceae bacterium JC049]|nr:1-deoxy-D-xylulose-5-phosphate synthase [Prolixibacteraceae bacterium JC049]
MEDKKEQLFQHIEVPEDLRKVDMDRLPEVCDDLRKYIIDEVANNPGHLGASLGVVELTVALHYAYNTPYDQLVWDVGHQAYGHKILTGRKEKFHTNRKYKGISGFPKRSESEFDSFGVGHSSTSISAALGMSVAAKINNEERKIVAVIGDGAMTGGMAFEGLNNAAITNSDILIVLNDNNMAIDPNVGGLNNYLLDMTRSSAYNKLKKDIWDGLGKGYGFGKKTRRLMQRTENAIKAALLKQSNLFESLGARYFGPVDGHDVVYLTKVFKDLQRIKGPKILHVVTQKGKGYDPAEKNQTQWHAPGKFNPETGEIIKEEEKGKCPPKYQEVFGRTLVELARQNDKITGITPAMPTGCSMTYMMDEFPDRSFDVGIAEQHAVTFSAGLATQGMIPFCNIYSTFMQRAYDQILHDVALQNLNVVFCLDRGGLVGSDGATHHGVYDIAYLRHIPNMTVAAPMNEVDLRNMMYTAQQENMGPFSIRYPRGKGVEKEWEQPLTPMKVGKAVQISEGEKVAILTIGHVGNFAAKAIRLLKDELDTFPAHFDMRFVKPIDEELLDHVFENYDSILTIEDGCVMGGFGSAVAEYMLSKNKKLPIKMLGVPDEFIEQGTQLDLYRECGFDTLSIKETIKVMMSS